MDQTQFNTLLNNEIDRMSRLAIDEDLADNQGHDISAQLIPSSQSASATLITRESGILCGKAWVNQVFRLLDKEAIVNWELSDGDHFEPGMTLCRINANARALLTGERSAMNFLQTLSAVATKTNEYVKKIDQTSCKLLDTRKTIPGLRFGQKYAVQCGGGKNHRLGLSDAYLIKENHIMVCGGILQALSKAKLLHPEKLLEIEVESLSELELALDGGAEVIMLDNFSTDDMRTAISQRNRHSNSAKLEASGNISLETISQIAETGVDFVSVGAITKNIQAVDLSMRVIIEK